MADCFVLYKEAPNSPTLTYTEPYDRVYPIGEQTDFPECLETNSGIGASNFTVTVTLVGNGILGNNFPGIPLGLNVSDSAKEYVITGTAAGNGGNAELRTFLNFMYVFAPDGDMTILPKATGVTKFTILYENAEGTCASVKGIFIPEALVVDGQSACANVRVQFSVVSGNQFGVIVDGQEITTPGGVTSTSTSATALVDLLVPDINAQVGLVPEWSAADINGSSLQICSVAGSADFNDYEIQVMDLTQGTQVSNDAALTGGVDNNEPSLFEGIWDKSKDVLLGVAGNVAGGVLANWIFPNSGITEITIPQNNPDEPPPEILLVIQGIKVLVPTGYNAETRTYPGTYDSWVTAGRPFERKWTDCPAWTAYDYITNKRYGLGNDIILNNIQLHNLQKDMFGVMFFSDEKIDAGQKDGSTEPRFSMNTAVSEGTKMDILEGLCSNFNGGYTFSDGGLRITIDDYVSDLSTAMIVNQATVGAEGFKHTHNSLTSFVNKVNVSYVDPDTFYQEAIVTVEDQVGINTYGEKIQDLFAYGCTSRAQAARYGNWVLETEKRNRDIIRYKAGWDHYNVKPGDLMYVADDGELGNRLGGRIASFSFDGNNTIINLDGPFYYPDPVNISLRTQEEPDIPKLVFPNSSNGGYVSSVYFAGSDITANLKVMSPYILELNNIPAAVYRVIKIDEENEVQYNVTAQLYDGNKYAAIYADYFVGV